MIRSTLILTFALAVVCPTLWANDLTAEDIVRKANEASYYAGQDGRAKVSMALSDGRSREFVILRKNVEDSMNQMFYVYFNAPADVRRMAYLVHKNPDGEDDRWMFLPALNLVRRIAPGDKRTSFVGSDFFYEDVSGRGLEEDVHELIETTETQFVIKNTPKQPDSVEFASYTVWIDRETFLPRKAEYLNREGAVYRRVTADNVELIQGYPTVMQSTVEDLSAGTKTVNLFSEVEYDIGLNERIFTERFLRRPPREVTR